MFNRFVIYIQDRIDQFIDRDRRVKVAKIVRVFQREKELIDEVFASSHVQVCGHPGRCAIGALLVAAGEDVVSLLDVFSASFQQLERLSLEYGLDGILVEQIITSNDEVRIGRDGVLQTKFNVCSSLPITKARVCEVSAFVRTLEPA